MGDILKLILKFLFLIMIGLIISIIIYPLFHEMGHMISAVFFGAKVTDFEILPVAFTTLKVNTNTSDFGILAIGFSGYFFPFLTCFALSAKTFWIWYARIALRVICLISFLLGIVSIIMFKNDKIMFEEDIAIVLNYFPQYETAALLFFIILLIFAAVMFINDFAIFNKKELYKSF